MSDEKKRKRPRGTGAIFNRPGSANLWVGYTDANGKYIRESAGTSNKTEAQKFLRKRMEAVSGGNFLGPQVEKITVDNLYDDLLQDYRTHGKDVVWAEGRWTTHLKDFFGGMRASRVGTTQIAAYVERRQGEGAAKATLNRELALLRRAFSLGFDAEPQKVSRVPKFHKFIVSEKGNERRGFAEEAQYRKLAERAKEPWLRGLLALSFAYGFRRGDLLGEWEKGQWKRLPMLCKQVDLLNNTVTLYSGETKNGEGRTIALTEECRLLPDRTAEG